MLRQKLNRAKRNDDFVALQNRVANLTNDVATISLQNQNLVQVTMELQMQVQSMQTALAASQQVIQLQNQELVKARDRVAMAEDKVCIGNKCMAVVGTAITKIQQKSDNEMPKSKFKEDSVVKESKTHASFVSLSE